MRAIILLLFVFSSLGLCPCPNPSFVSSSPMEEGGLNSYIIHTRINSLSALAQNFWYNSLVKKAMLKASSNATAQRKMHQDPIFYTYDTVMTGFAASLTSAEAHIISKLPGVLRVQNDQIMEPHTTRSVDFLGLNRDMDSYNILPGEENVIVGIIDHGIWPESRSFDDEGFTDIPPEWRGECVSGEYFDGSKLCNKKLVGAKYFASGALTEFGKLGTEYMSARDKNGHGTHTSSTAVGSLVANASLFGFAQGTARGIAPKARLAMYKACWEFSPNKSGCAGTDIMKAMDAAVKDGVHVLSLSIGSDHLPFDFINNPIAAGAFGAVRKGVFIVCSAGNSGPSPRSVTNTAPWIMTVGAGSIDRMFPANVIIGNGEVFHGESLYVNSSTDPGQIMGMTSIISIGECSNLIALPPAVKGKIVVCNHGSVKEGMLVKKYGGVGLIATNGIKLGQTITANAFTIPAMRIGYRDGGKLMEYLNSTSNPRASLKFYYKTVIGEARAPSVASFSSRGPNKDLLELLKPDILAPGLNIIAAWPPELTLTKIETDTRRSSFNILSGTSMACPHVAGIAALLRGSHPDWTPAMIRSAMMTTAATLDHADRPILDENLVPATPLAYGAGHVDPIRAQDPGLVYDAGVQDYIDLLCTMNLTHKDISTLVPDEHFSCTTFEQGPSDLNYPSFSVVFSPHTKAKTLKRTLTKVSNFPEIYKARVMNSGPEKVDIVVEPTVLEFSGENEKRTYKVHFVSKLTRNITQHNEMEHGSVIWENDEHQVKAPAVVLWT